MKATSKIPMGKYDICDYAEDPTDKWMICKVRDGIGNPNYKQVLRKIEDDVNARKTFNDSLEKYYRKQGYFTTEHNIVIDKYTRGGVEINQYLLDINIYYLPDGTDEVLYNVKSYKFSSFKNLCTFAEMVIMAVQSMEKNEIYAGSGIILENAKVKSKKRM